MKTPYRKNCSQGPGHTRKDLFPIQIEHFSFNIKHIAYKALTRSIMVYACPICDYVANANLLKMQRLQNRFIRGVHTIDRRILVRELHVAFKFRYM
jgi:hypothetical protein